MTAYNLYSFIGLLKTWDRTWLRAVRQEDIIYLYMNFTNSKTLVHGAKLAPPVAPLVVCMYSSYKT